MSSFYVGISGLKAATTNLDTTSHNVANASTTGFKFGRAEFGDLVDSNAAMGGGLGVRTQAINQQFQQGTITTTGNALDLAIVGNGFFGVKNPDANGAGTGDPIYTRAGSFHIDANGVIVNNLGQVLQGVGGVDLKLTGTGPWSNIKINETTGVITANDSAVPPALITVAPEIGMVDFNNVQGLKQISDTQWEWTPEASLARPNLVAPGTGSLGNLMSGALETSNVDLTDQLVNMIIAQRDFQANSKTITTNQTLIETTTNMIR